MPKQSPLQIVNDKFGSKEKLAATVASLVDAQEGESKEDFLSRLKLVPNKKLLHLVALGEKAKELGGRDGMVKKIAEFKGQPKDKDFMTKLSQLPLGTLVDRCESLARAAKRAAK